VNISVDALWKMSDVELLSAYHELRRRYAERRFARDTERARLDWLKARTFAAAQGGVTERRNAADVSEELARKGQEVRQVSRDLELLRADIDLIVMVVRMRGNFLPTAGATDETADREDREDKGELA
jgi:hypothetical protein